MHCSWLVDSLAGVGPLKPEHENNRKGGRNCTEIIMIWYNYHNHQFDPGTISMITRTVHNNYGDWPNLMT